MTPPALSIGEPADGDLLDLLPIPSEVAQRYDTERSQVAARVDAALFRRPDLGVLLGDASSRSVRELHRYLAAFFGSVFTLGLPEMLVNGLPRLLAGYRSRGLTEDYFQTLPNLWKDALEQQMGRRAEPMVRICAWLEEHPTAWIPEDRETPGEASDAVRKLVTILLTGDLAAARSCIREEVGRGMPLDAIFVDLVQPALYEIGKGWEKGRLSAAQEHLASALVARLLASLGDTAAASTGRVAIVTTAPTETHEFGAWMVADILRAEGWDVRYLGAQLPVSEILQFARMVEPALIAVSVTLEIHLPSLRELVQALREEDLMSNTPVLVGGQAFGSGDRIWRSAGADAIARDAREVAAVARSLVENASAA